MHLPGIDEESGNDLGALWPGLFFPRIIGKVHKHLGNSQGEFPEYR